MNTISETNVYEAITSILLTRAHIFNWADYLYGAVRRYLRSVGQFSSAGNDRRTWVDTFDGPTSTGHDITILTCPRKRTCGIIL